MAVVAIYFVRYEQPAEVDGIWKSYWRCIACEKARRLDGIPGEACSLHVRHDGANETIVSDLEADHHQNCLPTAVGEVDAGQLK